MSGGSFNYLYKRHWNGEYDSILTDLDDMMGHLLGTGHPEAVPYLLEHRKVVQKHIDALQAACDRISPLLQAIEWNVSGDWDWETVENRLKEL